MDSRYAFRLKVRVAKTFEIEEPRIEFDWVGRSIEMASEAENVPIKDSYWLVFRSEGFPSKLAAQEYGERLRRACDLAGYFEGIGLDSGNDVVKLQFSDLVVDAVLQKTGRKIYADLHGLRILPHEPPPAFPTTKGYGTVWARQELFAESLKTAFEEDVHQSALVRRLLSLMNHATLCRDPLASGLLAISAIEMLGKDQNWNERQRASLADLSKKLDSYDLSPIERDELRRSIENCKKISIGEKVRRVLAEIGGGDLVEEWTRVYRIRSQLVHGSSNLVASEIQTFAGDATAVCCKITDLFLESQNIRRPSRV